MQLDGLKAETVPLKQEQEQVLALEKRAALLQDQAALKYAGLDCLLAVSEKLPPDLTLSTLSFSRGRVLTLRGQAPIDKPEEVSNFNDDLAGYTIDVELADDAGTGESLTVEQKLFSEVNQPNSSIRKGKTGQYLEWNFASQLLREETDEEEGE